MMEGGEIFIPKIPSMKITDLVEAVSPKSIQTHVIGIRPGEKLHELMLTADESLQTVELNDRYIVLPFDETMRADYVKQATPISKRFTYSSETNTQWLNPEQLKAMIEAYAN
jgi:UDP-N-acetylglucosamine 4,6-dehydratase